jgi:hypothetical protein
MTTKSYIALMSLCKYDNIATRRVCAEKGAGKLLLMKNGPAERKKRKAGRI